MKTDREKKTVLAMIRIYCREIHFRKKKDLCGECLHLYEYAVKRTDSCRFLPGKPVCSKCAVHCYEPDKLDFIRKVMRYAGPKMPGRHPYLALMYFADGLKEKRKRRPG
ncbi:MAG: nitrous oxide-stimulated promoter family protein [Candidatus Goldiibacteriota bacterium]